MLGLAQLRPEHGEAVLAFERENRAYFARSITDRGEAFYERFDEHLRALLAEQDTGVCAFYVLVDDHDSAIVGRFNLYDLRDGAADVGYRVAERVAGRGVATWGLLELCRVAARRHGLRILTAKVSQSNIASQRVLEKAGFAPKGDCAVGGQPGLTFGLDLAHVASAPKRVLIDWDWGAHGIWTILSPEERTAPAPAGAWLSYKRPASEQPPRRPWSDKLSGDLLDALQEWNDHGGRLFHYAEPELVEQDGEAQLAAFHSRAAELAAWTQRELGPGYEVLFVRTGGAWQWVEPPAVAELRSDKPKTYVSRTSSARVDSSKKHL